MRNHPPPTALLHSRPLCHRDLQMSTASPFTRETRGHERRVLLLSHLNANSVLIRLEQFKTILSPSRPPPPAAPTPPGGEATLQNRFINPVIHSGLVTRRP